MYETYSRMINEYANEIKDTLKNGNLAISELDDLYTIFCVQMSYNKFVQICKYIFSKKGIKFNVSVNSRNKIILVFGLLPNGKSKTYNGEGRCSLCDEYKFGSEHHIKPRSFGGTNVKKNLVFLCIECHDKIELFCSCCGNSKTICDRQMFNSCWRRDNVYFLQTEESKDVFNDINEIPRYKIKKQHRKRKMQIRNNKCMICNKTFYEPLYQCEIVRDVIMFTKKTMLKKDKLNPNVIKMCNGCYDYALMIEKAQHRLKENQKIMYQYINNKDKVII